VYAVIAEAPSAGAVQLIVMPVFKTTVVVGAAGVAGAFLITAPLPEGDVAELPTAFVASTVAKILAPHARLYGVACKTDIGTEQLVIAPLQLGDSAVKVTPSL
jgi:hypothetical protein